MPATPSLAALKCRADARREKTVRRAKETHERAILAAQAVYDDAIGRADRRLASALERARDQYQADADAAWERHGPLTEGA